MGKSNGYHWSHYLLFVPERIVLTKSHVYVNAMLSSRVLPLYHCLNFPVTIMMVVVVVVVYLHIIIQ